MHHLAIMNPRWHLIEKILHGEKTIESRWYKNKVAPWNRVSAGDSVYFKDAGKAVTATAFVSKVIQQEIHSIIEGLSLADKYKNQLCFTDLAFTDPSWLKDKKYSILIFLKNPQSVAPFEIDKTGFGNACAWLCVEDINFLRKTNAQ